MQPAELKRLLERVRRGRVSPAAAARRIDEAPLEQLAFATLDHQRAQRSGFPEVVFGQGKTPAQLVAIVGRLFEKGGPVLATRVDEAGRAALARAFPQAVLHELARCVVLPRSPRAGRAPGPRHGLGAGGLRRHRRSAGGRGGAGHGPGHGQQRRARRRRGRGGAAPPAGAPAASARARA